MNKLSFLFLLFIFSYPQTILAADTKSQFNFDENYQGEDTSGKKEGLVYDPLEHVNRKVFAFNEALDKYLALPIVRQYHKFVPDLIRKSVHNFVTNIETPFSVANSILQGNGENSMASFSSFLINTTLGVGGLFDVAGSKKIKYNEEDLGQTLGTYGLGSGPYLVIPFLGPSDLRDFSGLATEKAIDPLSFNVLQVGGESLIDNSLAISLSITKAIDTREELIDIIDDVRKNSFDVYATYRSAYLQKRQSLILNK